MIDFLACGVSFVLGVVFAIPAKALFTKLWNKYVAKGNVSKEINLKVAEPDPVAAPAKKKKNKP